MGSGAGSGLGAGVNSATGVGAGVCGVEGVGVSEGAAAGGAAAVEASNNSGESVAGAFDLVRADFGFEAAFFTGLDIKLETRWHAIGKRGSASGENNSRDGV